MQAIFSEDGRIKAASFDTELVGGITIDPPEGFTLEHAGHWRMDGDVLICDPPEDMPEPISDSERLDQIEAAVIELAGIMAEVNA